MAKRLPKFSEKERQELQEELKSMNSTCARLIESFLNVLDESDDPPDRKELMKTNFLFAVVNALQPVSRLSVGLADSLEASAEELRAAKNPIAANVEGLAHAIRMRLKRFRP